MAINTAEQSALLAIAETAEHSAFAAAASPPTEATLVWFGQQMIEIMEVAREGAGLPLRNWPKS